jgi:hypothetical protein
MKSPSEIIETAISESLAMAASLERERCANLVEQLSDGTEDQVIKGILNEVVTAIRRLPYVSH